MVRKDLSIYLISYNLLYIILQSIELLVYKRMTVKQWWC